jgi:chemotaxis protein MotB
MSVSSRRRFRTGFDIWPGFVDALSTLLLVIIFLLSVFVLAQFFLGQALSGRDQALIRLRAQVAELSNLLSLEREANTDLRQTVAQLSATLQASNVSREEMAARLRELEGKLAEAGGADAELLNQQVARYRSEFFGRLREILGDRADVRVQGDRFIFQSEVLFDTASDELGADGRRQLQHLAGALKEIAAKIPPDIDWILLVEGHTDVRPIKGGRFASNWELSTARALSVVHLLQSEGIPPERLGAAGYGPFHPLDTGYGEEALARNRRIELKLTSR